jgi:eukaryotic-like serine/threonine-protein kinase
VLRDLLPDEPRIIGPYKLVGQLGDGGMGRVYLGRSAGGRPVAVKVVHRHYATDPDFRVRFRREVAAARKVSGLFTAMVVDADVDAPQPWLATAYVAGPSLQEAVHDTGPLPLRSLVALAAGLAESLVAIHAAGVVHRDLKPSNVLLGQDGPCVIDFGISRATESTSVTRAGFVLGSPGFMSPEQAEGDPVGPPTDIFSLGAVLAFAATGQPPFGAGSTAAMIYRIVYTSPQLDGVPAEIRPMIARCLAKDPSQRPTASELLAEAEAAEPMAGWLPEPITRAFANSLGPPAAELPLPAIETQEALDGLPTVTGDSLPIPHDEAPAPHDEAPAADALTEAPDAVAEAPDAMTEAPAAVAEVPEAAALAGEAKTGPREPAAAAPGADTVVPVAEAAAEAQTGPQEADRPAALEPTAATTVVPGPEPSAAIVPLPGADLPGRPRRRPVRLLVLGAAAAVILVAAAATGLALQGSGHASAHGRATPSVSTSAPLGNAPPVAQLATTAQSPSAARTSPHSSAASSRRPSAQHTTQAAVTQAPTTAPAVVPSSAKSTPKPTPKPSPKPSKKPTPKPAAAPYVSSVSGAAEESCGVIGSVRSTPGASVGYSFADNSSSNLRIGVINTSGALVWEDAVGPDLVGGETAAVGDYWVVATSSGACLAVVHITGSGETVIS